MHITFHNGLDTLKHNRLQIYSDGKYIGFIPIINPDNNYNDNGYLTIRPAGNGVNVWRDGTTAGSIKFDAGSGW